MSYKYTIIFLICTLSLSLAENGNFVSSVEEKMETKFGEYSNYLANWLKSINDKHLVKSDVGRMLYYEELEPLVDQVANAQGRSLKKIGPIIPLIFHLGMSSAMMLLTMLLAAKGVAIGLTLLVLKIAVGSAKLVSYFTEWKNKYHHEYIPHHEHHGHKRSLRSIETHLVHPDHSYSPEHYHHENLASPYHHESSPTSPYHQPAYGEYEYNPQEKKAQQKNFA